MKIILAKITGVGINSNPKLEFLEEMEKGRIYRTASGSIISVAEGWKVEVIYE